MSLARLDASNFTSSISAARIALVLFSLPGCPHEPDGLRSLISGATEFLPDDALTAIVEDSALGQANGARSFPALRLYFAGQIEPKLFHGPLDSPRALASFLRREASPLPLEIGSTEEIRDEIAAVEQAAILFSLPDASARITLTAAFADDGALHRRVSLIFAPPHLAKHFEPVQSSHDAAGSPLLLLYRAADDPEAIVFDGTLSADGVQLLRDWYAAAAASEPARA